MNKSIDRRNFNKLTAAALGGMMAGTSLIGCSKPATETADAGADVATGDGEAADGKEKHACRGLNTCEGQGVKGENTCAGAGTCATVAAHSCAGQNTCKHLGGCGENPGANECAGKGGCAVPITHDGKWEEAREAFEARMKEAGKEVHPAPPA